MSELIATEHQPDLSALTGSPGGKRKRDPNSPSAQRAKRTAPAANMSTDIPAYIESALQVSNEAHAVNGGVNVADFNALQQATQEGLEVHDPTSQATTTAQAALGMYPTLHVPQSTEEQFAAQDAADAAAEQQHHDTTYNPPDVPQVDGLMTEPIPQDQQPPPNGVQQPRTPTYSASGGTPHPKPTVGSEEWHKMRKDNHKEGEASNV